MKKFILISIMMFFALQTCVFADEIIDADGNVIKCKLESISAGYIVYKKDGMRKTFTRRSNSPIFNDYVDVKLKLTDKSTIVRYTGEILSKDFQETIIKTDEGRVFVPWYKLKGIGVYKP